MKTLWQTLNKPFVLLLLAFALWPFVSAWEHRLAVRSTSNAVFAELDRANHEMNDQAKHSGIKELVASFVSQFIGGFTSAFEGVNHDQEIKQADFTAAQAKVVLRDIKVVPSAFSSREKIIGVIHNGTDTPISSLHLNTTMFGADGHLIDVADESLSDVKLLQPGQEVGFSIVHDLGNTDQDKAAIDARRAAQVDVQVVSFSIDRPKAK